MTDSATSPSALTDDIRAFLDDHRYATIATIDPDGAPHQAVVWYTVEGDEIVINSAIGPALAGEPAARSAASPWRSSTRPTATAGSG